MRIVFFSEVEEWVDGVVKYISNCAESAIKEYDSFHIVLSGGDTPKLIYNKLTELNTNWNKWHFWIADERFPSETFTQLNKTMIQTYFLNKIPCLDHQVHFMMVELGLDEAVRNYNEAVKSITMFDLSLLGIGEDGHTASLFPDNYIGFDDNSEDVLIVTRAPKEPKNRLSLSAKRLRASRNIIFITKGKNKKSILDKIQTDDTLPCNIVAANNESCLYNCNI